jgi:hypothetical protein
MQTVATIPELVELLGKGLTGTITGVKGLLGTNTVTPSRNSQTSDLTLPTFTGYVEKSITWSTVNYDPGSTLAQVVATTILQWDGPSDASGQNILSFGVHQPGAAGPPVVPEYLLGCCNLDTPASLHVPTDQLSIALYLRGDGTIFASQL